MVTFVKQVEDEKVKKEGKRSYWVSHRGGLPFMVHLVSGTCVPREQDNVGFLSKVEQADSQEFFRCPKCKPI